jgi:hypothetical protein
MSWSVTAEIVRNDDADAQVTIKHRQQQTGHGEEESAFAIDRAVRAATLLIDDLAVGRGTFDVTLSGHSNPRNQPSPGWANDCLNIRIEQRKQTAG